MRAIYFSLRRWSTGNLGWLYSARILHSVAYNFWELFGPVYLVVQFRENILIYAGFYLVLHVVHFFMLPLISPHVIKGDLKRPIYLAIPFVLLYYLCLYLMPLHPLGFGLAIIAIIPIFRTLYWPPYHAQVAEFSDAVNRSKQVNIIFVLTAIIGIFVPIMAGFIIDRWGFSWLLVPPVVLWVLSIYPLRRLKSVAEYYSWSFRETMKYFLHPHNRRQVIIYAAEGINDAGALFIWPVALWILLNKEVVNMGLLVGAVIFVTAITRFILAQYTEVRNKRKTLSIGVFFNALSWLGRIFVITPLQIFVNDSVNRVSIATTKTPFDTLMYAKAADTDNYVDEYSVIREMAIAAGRTLLFVVMFAAIIYAPDWWMYITFSTIALMTLLLRWQSE